MQDGGCVLCSCKSGLTPDEKEFAIDLGVVKEEQQPTDLYGSSVVGKIYDRGDYCQYLMPGNVIGKSLPKDYHVMYSRGLAVKERNGAEVLVNAYASVFDRDYRHFCSHRQSPCSGKLQQPAVVRKENCVYFANPVFSQYQYNAPRWCKEMVLDAIKMLLGRTLLCHDGPSALVTAIQEQRERNRWVVHMLHYIPERRCEAMDVIEDVIPVYGIHVELKVEKKVHGVACQPQNLPLAFVQDGDRLSFTIPEVNGHQMIAVQFME